MHGRGVHGEHDVEVGHKGHLVGEGHDADHGGASVEVAGEGLCELLLVGASAEDEDAYVGACEEEVDDLCHAVKWVHLATVLGERGDAYPLVVAFVEVVEGVWERLSWADVQGVGYGEVGVAEHLGVARGGWCQLFVGLA